MYMYISSLSLLCELLQRHSSRIIRQSKALPHELVTPLGLERHLIMSHDMRKNDFHNQRSMEPTRTVFFKPLAITHHSYTRKNSPSQRPKPPRRKILGNIRKLRTLNGRIRCDEAVSVPFVRVGVSVLVA